MAAIRDVRFGRLRLPTIFDDVQEAVGDSIQSVGGGVVPGERQARSLSINLPLSGSPQEIDPYSYGEKVRRQMRSLMENARARLSGIYFRFAADTDLNSWLIVGAGDIVYDTGGVTIADFKINLRDVFKVGSLWTHRAARRVEMFDRRLATTPRDTLGTIFGTDFASATATGFVYLTVSATDITGTGVRAVDTGSRPSVSGDVRVVIDSQHGEILSYEIVEDLLHVFDDVIIYDRRASGLEVRSGYGSAVIALGPRGFWRLGEQPGSGGVANDSSIYGNHGTYIGSVVLGLDPPILDENTAAGMAQTGGAYMSGVDSSSLDIAADISFVGWIRPDAGLTGYQGIMSKAASVAGGYGWRFGWDPATAELIFGISTDGLSETVVVSTGATIDEQIWQHVAVVFDSVAQTVTFYKNGIVVSTVSGVPSSIYSNSRKVSLGVWEAD